MNWIDSWTDAATMVTKVSLTAYDGDGHVLDAQQYPVLARVWDNPEDAAAFDYDGPTKEDVRQWKESKPLCKQPGCMGSPTIYGWRRSWKKEGIDGYCGEHEDWAFQYPNNERV